MPSPPAHGYSATPLPRKLGIAPGSRVALLGAPASMPERLGHERPHRRLLGAYDVIVAFCDSRAALERRLGRMIAALEPRGGLWIAWPKRASGVASDLDDRTVREIVLARGLVDNKVCAIDGTWSALRFVRRRDPR